MSIFPSESIIYLSQVTKSANIAVLQFGKLFYSFTIQSNGKQRVCDSNSQEVVIPQLGRHFSHQEQQPAQRTRVASTAYAHPGDRQRLDDGRHVSAHPEHEESQQQGFHDADGFEGVGRDGQAELGRQAVQSEAFRQYRETKVK